LNGDGLDDVLIGKPTVKVMLSTGGGAAGMLLAPVHYGSVEPFPPVHSLPAELNGDGRPDLVVAGSDPKELRVLLNAGDGTFAAGATYPQPSDFYQMVGVGDMDHDAYTDVVMLSTSAVYLMRGTGTGELVQDSEPLLAGPWTGRFVLGDLDNDGWLDIVAVSTPDVKAYLNDGKGRLGAATISPVGTGSSCDAIADLTGDGIPDLVVGHSGAMMSGGLLEVLPGEGKGVFGAGVTWHADQARPAAVGDLDGDGWLDLAAGTNSEINVVLNSGHGTPGELFSFPELHGAFPEAMAIGDLNGDGRRDIVVAHRKWDHLSVLVNWCAN